MEDIIKKILYFFGILAVLYILFTWVLPVLFKLLGWVIGTAFTIVMYIVIGAVIVFFVTYIIQYLKNK